MTFDRDARLYNVVFHRRIISTLGYDFPSDLRMRPELHNSLAEKEFVFIGQTMSISVFSHFYHWVTIGFRPCFFDDFLIRFQP